MMMSRYCCVVHDLNLDTTATELLSVEVKRRTHQKPYLNERLALEYIMAESIYTVKVIF